MSLEPWLEQYLLTKKVMSKFKVELSWVIILWKRNNDLLNQSGIDAYNIQRVVVDEETTLNNRASIRALMGTKSAENQDKIIAEKEAKEKEVAEERARLLEIQRQEEVKISRYMDLQKLSKAWRIYDNEKLKVIFVIWKGSNIF